VRGPTATVNVIDRRSPHTPLSSCLAGDLLHLPDEPAGVEAFPAIRDDRLFSYPLDQSRRPATILYVGPDQDQGGPMDSSPEHDQFVECFVRFQDRIYAYVVLQLPNRDDAEEVFQQTSLVLWKKWRQFDPGRDFVRWACGIAHHEVRNFLRKQAHRGRLALSEDVLAELGKVRLDMHDVLEARRLALRHCLGRLEPDKRDLLERCYAEKDAIKTIAGERGQPPNVLYMTLKRLRKALFDCINRTLAAEGLP
jgi:RNA polymerase sigma-70 factor (ECF subfamily)